MIIIDFEDPEITLTVVRGKKVTFAAKIPLESGWVQDGVIVNKTEVRGLLSKSLGDNAIAEKEAIACISGVHSIYRVIYAPRMERNLLAEAAQKEIERVIPVPLDTIYTFWQDVKISGVETALCLVGVPRDNIDSVLETVRMCGLQLRFVELKPLAVARVADEKTAIVIDVNQAGFDLTILVDGIPEIIRSLSFPSSAMIDLDKVTMVKDETERTINFYNASHKERPLSNTTFCYFNGDLRDKLSQVMGFPAKPMPALLTYPANCDHNDYVANTGMALRLLGKGSHLARLEINFIPGVIVARPAKKPGYTPLIALGLALAIVAGTYFTMQMVAGGTVSLQADVNQKMKVNSELQKQIKATSDKQKVEEDAYKKTVATLKEPLDYLAQQRAGLNADLGKAFALLPGTMNLISIENDGKTIIAEGKAPSEEMVMGYARDLRQSSRFQLVMVTAIDIQEYNEVNFLLTITLKQ
ncbi:MAG: pilus assembly protein PilM [Dehalococcoidia bacterium]|nr:pilus assembly protein PilM [Dehalococcoidia bacterium]MDD5495342.1 pilus assembly protein PilM [Dehalococcoidia bacterium]